jgi:hypothetical protein
MQDFFLETKCVKLRSDNSFGCLKSIKPEVVLNKRPTNISKNKPISTLIHFYMFRRFIGAIFREFSRSLLNFCPVS